MAIDEEMKAQIEVVFDIYDNAAMNVPLSEQQDRKVDFLKVKMMIKNANFVLDMNYSKPFDEDRVKYMKSRKMKSVRMTEMEHLAFQIVSHELVLDPDSL